MAQMMSPGEATVSALRHDVALQIARLVKRSGATQTDAADRLGLPQPTLSKIVNGRVGEISLELLIRIAVKAELPFTLNIGRVPEESGAFASLSRRPPELRLRSPVGVAARESLAMAESRLTPSQRLEAFLEHNQLLAMLRQSSRPVEPTSGGSSRPADED